MVHPEAYPVNISENQVEPAIVISGEGVRTSIWHAEYDGLFRKEIFCPEPESFLPSIKIIPVNFQYGVPGSSTDWQSYGNWQYRLAEGLQELPVNEMNRIVQMIHGTSDKKEIIRTLYHYLQDHIRYINVSIDIGGLKPYPATYVSENKYGDCKALTNYMKALLEVAGIKSYYTKVYAGTQPRQLIFNLPSQQFNHVILTVPLDGDTIWLENTSNVNPIGYVGTFIQNRDALLVDEKQSKIIRLPALKENEVQEGRRFDFNINKDGNTELTLRYTFRGDNFEKISGLQTEYNTDVQNQVMHNILSFPYFEMKGWNLTRPDRDARSMTLVSDLSVKNILGTIGNEYYFSFIAAYLPEFTSPKTRRLPVSLPYSLCSCDTMVYHLPEGINTVTFPTNTSIVNKYGRYQINFRRDGSKLIILRDICLYRGYYEPPEYSQFYSFLSAIKADEKRKIIIQ